jgi:hypothetical protein
MKDNNPVESIARNWNRIEFLSEIGLLSLAGLPLKFKTEKVKYGS